jgi:hypothetical protein
VNCKKLSLERCTDSIHHRSDFTSKEEFNDYLDTRIMKSMDYEVGQIVEVKDIIKNADKYLDAIFDIYKGNDIDHTRLRKQYVFLGIKKKRAEVFYIINVTKPYRIKEINLKSKDTALLVKINKLSGETLLKKNALPLVIKQHLIL